MVGAFRTTRPNQYEDSLVATQPGPRLLSGIQCENCHGPLAQHFGPGVGVDKSLRSEVCAPCHFSSDRHPKGYSWDASGHAASFDEGKEWSYMNRSGCSQCHTGNGFAEAYNNIPGATTGGMPILSGSPARPATTRTTTRTNISCAGHRLPRLASAATKRASARAALHHSHQGPMILGTEATPFAGNADRDPESECVSGWELPGYVYENGSHSEIEERCAACHMAPTPTYDPTYRDA